MPEPRGEGSPYPKADLTLRGLARGCDFALAFLVARLGHDHELGILLAALYLLAADGLMHGQSFGKRIFGVRAMVVPRRAPVGWRESFIRNSPFALVALFGAIPILWIALPVVGLPVLGYEAWRVVRDPLGLRLGDALADTQVVDGKVVSRIEVVVLPDPNN
ncbi:MAG TPA: RDD family protein [Anaeromyxobacteraceae bacterium]|jgi:uncharacterized RDD family membrane protein YckC|nr:RDD family protein [Anaeromyxobacteraceae bacterium]